MPGSVAIGNKGDVYIADTNNHLLRMVTVSGIIATLAGIYGRNGFNHEAIISTNSYLNYPTDVLVSAADSDVYICDSFNHRIRRVSAADGIITSYAGSSNVGGYNSDNILAINARLNYPTGIGMDRSGVLYIADTLNHRIRKVDLNGIISTVAGTLAYTHAHTHIYTHQPLLILLLLLIRILPGNGLAGFAEGYLTATRTYLSHPSDVAVGNNGCFYIADTYNNAVRVVNAAGIISPFAG